MLPVTITSYQGLDSLKNYFLEDSYVLAIHIFPGRLAIELDAVLTNEHPGYVNPRKGEQYCFKRSIIIFDGITSIIRFSFNYDVAIDVNDEMDMGNIDYLAMEDGNLFHVSGPWGNIDLIAESVSMELS
jgi:hypothetical protein